MNGFIVVEQLEVKLPEPQDDGCKENEKKDSFEGKKLFDLVR